jgi:hypothetical protein
MYQDNIGSIVILKPEIHQRKLRKIMPSLELMKKKKEMILI